MGRYKIAALVLAATVLSACGAPAASPSPTPEPTPPTETLMGTFVLHNGDPAQRQNRGGEIVFCRGTGGYDDIQPGLEVVVRDGAGAVLGVGDLVTVSRNPPPARDLCHYSFEVGGLPVVDFYSVEVGRRGELTYSHADLEELGWAVELSLGL